MDQGTFAEASDRRYLQIRISMDIRVERSSRILVFTSEIYLIMSGAPNAERSSFLNTDKSEYERPAGRHVHAALHITQNMGGVHLLHISGTAGRIALEFCLWLETH